MNNSNGGFMYLVQPGDNYWVIAQRFQIAPENILAANPNINPYFLLVGQHIFIPVSHPTTQNKQKSECINPAAVKLMNDNRSLWEEHVAWTRMAIISLVFNLPDVNFVVARLLKNATDMGEMIRPLYGDAAANRYTELIKEHLTVAADLVKAAIAKDQQAASMAEQKWYANADEIAAFLSSINPYLPESEMREMFYHHLDLTKQEAASMIDKNYKKDIEIYDKIERQAREMADTISEAMVRLYPNNFG